jgi:regulation of enolase protein 1 (concanavalin A-like superfamily)
MRTVPSKAERNGRGTFLGVPFEVAVATRWLLVSPCDARVPKHFWRSSRGIAIAMNAHMFRHMFLGVLPLLAACAAPTSETVDPEDDTVLDADAGKADGSMTRLARSLRASDFDSHTQWRFRRETRADWRTYEGTFEIRNAPGTLWKDDNDLRNLALLPVADESFSASVRVDGIYRDQSEQGGLIYYVDDDNYVKLVKERQVLGAFDVVTMVTEEDGAIGLLDMNIGYLGQDTVELRMDVQGDQIVGYYRKSSDREWTEFATTRRLEGFRAPRIGLFAQGTDPSSQRRTTFTEFELAPL